MEGRGEDVGGYGRREGVGRDRESGGGGGGLVAAGRSRRRAGRSPAAPALPSEKAASGESGFSGSALSVFGSVRSEASALAGSPGWTCTWPASVRTVHARSSSSKRQVAGLTSRPPSTRPKALPQSALRAPSLPPAR